MEKAGFKVDRHQINISVAIKAIGLFTIPVVLHPEVKVNITVNVARSEDEAERQARGEDVLTGRTDQEEAVVAAEELFEEGAAPEPDDAEEEEPAEA
jgi:large subunit ribosomal protein L9